MVRRHSEAGGSGSMISLRPMRVSDLEAASALGVASKATWRYAADRMAVFKDELTLSANDLSGCLAAQVATDGERPVGYFTLRRRADESVELEHLFVAPDSFGSGIGTVLLEAALEAARAEGVGEITIISDPNATGFYTRRGARIVGEHQSSIPGRTLPILTMATGRSSWTR